MSKLNDEIKAAIDSFDVERARALLRDALKEPNADTYYLASQVAINDDQKVEFLKKALQLDPFHPKAGIALDKLNQPTPPMSAAPAQPSGMSSEAFEKSMARQKSYIVPAIITFVLTFFFWIPGVIANILFLRDASRTQKRAETSLPGVGCLRWLLFVNLIIPVGFIVLLIINSVNTNIQNMNRAATQVANSQMSASQQAAAKLTSVAYATNEMATSRAFIIALTQTPAAAALSARQTAAYNATQIAQSVALTQTLDTSKIAPTLTALPSPIAAGSTNTAWKPIEYEFNGVPMVLVPAGCFNMGSNNGNKDERPPTPICFSSPFWIDTIEVTQGQFKYFGGSKAKATARNVSTYPIAEVTWFEARDFCAIRGMRLPTEAEWEYAARGPQALRYPWGNTNTAASTMSWAGAANMAGVTEDNVSEWTSSEYKPYPYNESDGRENPDDRSVKRVVRGGFWGFTDDWRSAVRVALLPNETFQYTGFRCASIARGKPIVSTAAPTAGTTTSTTSTAPTTIPAQASRTVVATLASSATMPSQSSSSTGTINDLNNVNVREKPDFAARIRTSVKPGTKVTILGMNDDKLWYHIQLDDGTEGWVWASYINLSTTAGATTVSPTTVSTQSSTGVINDLNNVNVRENPDSTARIRTSVKPGTKVTILGMNDDKSWYHIQLDDGTEGWVRATFVNLSN